MNVRSTNVILAQMMPKERPVWTNREKHISNRLARNTAFFAAGSLCLGLCLWTVSVQPEKTKAVMSHLSTGFEYDETLGRLQLVSNILPESAMVFLNTEDSLSFESPVNADIVHVWSRHEPWIEYTHSGDVSSCGSGEVITVVKNHTGTHTVRILHTNGYESIYSGLKMVYANEHDTVQSGQIIGTSSETTAFELRKEGVSILPTFVEI